MRPNVSGHTLGRDMLLVSASRLGGEKAAAKYGE